MARRTGIERNGANSNETMDYLTFYTCNASCLSRQMTIGLLRAGERYLALASNGVFISGMVNKFEFLAMDSDIVVAENNGRTWKTGTLSRYIAVRKVVLRCRLGYSRAGECS